MQPVDLFACGPLLGARQGQDGSVEIRVRAPSATRIEVALFSVALGELERLRLPMELPQNPETDHFALRVEQDTLLTEGLGDTLYYGLRVWGSNWPYDASWEPGSEAGRISDVDEMGARMNPNKLVLDPYALEVSHDPITPNHPDGNVFLTDSENRLRDSGPFAPKGVIIPCEAVAAGPQRPMRDEVIYEVHLRGLTMADPLVPEPLRGTYAGAAQKAAVLRQLGVTAVEFLPLHETPNDQNELTADASGDNYWG